MGAPEGPQRAQIEPSRANCSQIWPKLARSWPQQAPRTPPCALLGPQEAPQELPKGPQESPQRGSKSNMNLRHYPMMIFFSFLIFWGTGPIAKIIVFLMVLYVFINQLFRYKTVSGPHLEAIWSPFWGPKRAPNELGNDCLHHIEVELPTRPLLSPHRALKKAGDSKRTVCSTAGQDPGGG